MANTNQYSAQIGKLQNLTLKNTINWAKLNSGTYYYSLRNPQNRVQTITIQKLESFGKSKYILQIQDADTQDILLDIESNVGALPDDLAMLYMFIEQSIDQKSIKLFDSFIDQIEKKQS